MTCQSTRSGGGKKAIFLLHRIAFAVQHVSMCNPAVLLCRFELVNGFLIPGGAAPLRPGHTFFDTASEVVRLADAANAKGDAFPILGICLGFETLAIIASGNTSIMERHAQRSPTAACTLPLQSHAHIKSEGSATCCNLMHDKAY